MQNSSTILLGLFELAGYSTYAASQTTSGSLKCNGSSSPSIQLPKLAMKTVELQKQELIVAGLGSDGRGYVLDDLSCRLSPGGWASKAIAAYDQYEADALVVEINQGGAMVEAVLRAERSGLPLRQVRASRGKTTRAEPIAALYEQGRVSHARAFPTLEEQMARFTPFGIDGGGLADRVDALVWALWDLFPRMVRPQPHVDWGDDAGGGGSGSWLL